MAMKHMILHPVISIGHSLWKQWISAVSESNNNGNRYAAQKPLVMPGARKTGNSKYIAINDNFDTSDQKRMGIDMAGIKNWINDNLA